MVAAITGIVVFVMCAAFCAFANHRLRNQYAHELATAHDAERVVRHRAERLQEALTRAHQRLNLATTAGHMGLWDHEPATGKLVWDDGMLRLHAVERHHLHGTLDDWWAGVHPDDRAEVRRGYEAALASQLRFERSFRVVRPGGEVRWVRCTARIHRGEGGQPERVVGVFEDHTEHRVVQQALHEARGAAEAASGAKTRFLANMSHEIRTPLNAVTGLIFLLLRERHSPRVRQKLMKINDAAYSLLGIIDDILDFSKIEAGKVTSEAQPFSLPRVIGTSLDMVRAHADDKQLVLRAERAPGVPETLVGDPHRLGQILTNLLSNAVKFTEEGSVSLEVTIDSDDGAECALAFVVRDTGIGMDPNTASRVFQPFAQADPSSTRSHHGTGLGLAIVHSLVDHLGGSLHLDTAPDCGSVFRVVLPFEHVDASLHVDDPDEEPLGVAPLTGLHLLVVDDHPVNREVAQAILEASGARVDVAEHGVAALEWLDGRERLPDAVLMDLQMPRMDGHQATSRIRATPGLQRLPVVAMTANATVDDRREALAHGMDDFVAKPFDTTVLFRTILRVTKRSAPVVAAAPDAPRSVSGVDIATALARMGGDAQLLDRQLRRLVRATESDVARARRLCDDGDLAGAAEPMHRIVGAASTLGCDDLAAAAHDAEQRLLGDGWLDATVFQRVERHLSVLARALAPDPVPQAERTVDHLAVQRLCTALRDALRAQTLEAEPLLDQLDELLDPPTRHALQVVRAHVEELEYPAALSHLDQLRLGGVS